MKKSEIIQRRKELVDLYSNQYLTEDEHEELHSLSAKLLKIYNLYVDIHELSDEEIEANLEG